MNAPGDDRPDIRIGDLVKVTSKQDPEYIRQSRVASVRDGFVSLKFGHGFWLLANNVEVLDRPQPPIDEALLIGAIEAYRKAEGFTAVPSPDTQRAYCATFTPVINFIREYDNNKESNA